MSASMPPPEYKLWRVDFDGVAYVVARDKYTAERIAARHASEECQPYGREAQMGEKAYEWHEALPYFEGDAPHDKTVGQLIAEMGKWPGEPEPQPYNAETTSTPTLDGGVPDPQ